MEHLKKILYKSSTIILPDHVSLKDLANSLGHFFTDKIMKIRTALQLLAPVSITTPSISNSILSSFEPVSEDNILKILKSSPTKSYNLDPVPTSLVKECSHPNHPNYQYHKLLAHITPHLKKPSLGRNLLKNNRPVSNLSFISKLIENAVANQITVTSVKRGSPISTSQPTRDCILQKQHSLKFK